MSADWKIYTKTGDGGQTSLIGGDRVPKYHERIEAYGTLDELNSFIGLLRDSIDIELYRAVLLEIQDRVFTIESLLAAVNEHSFASLPKINEEDVLFLEKEIDAMNDTLPALSSFILPGGSLASSYAHVARTVCRRAERLMVKISRNTPMDELCAKYVNRLSDYLFVLSRKLLYESGLQDIPWIPRR